MDPQTILNVVGVGLMLLVAAAAAVAYYRANYAKATIELLEKRATAQAERIRELETSQTALRAQNDALRGVVTAKADIDALRVLVVDQHRETLKRVDDQCHETRRHCDEQHRETLRRLDTMATRIIDRRSQP